LLHHLYAEAQPKINQKRSENLNSNQSNEYHKNTLRNVRAAIKRHVHDIGRDFDIVRDKDFRSANAMLDGKLKFNTREGFSRPTKHKNVIELGDLLKISTYLHSEINPVVLRFRVWYNLAIHFSSRGLEFHQQLSLNSFHFNTDTLRVLSSFRGGGIACLNDPDSYAGWSIYTPVRASQARQVEG